jgi:hypothetical protein
VLLRVTTALLLASVAVACGASKPTPPRPSESAPQTRSTAFIGSDCPGGTGRAGVGDPPSQNPPGTATAKEALAGYLQHSTLPPNADDYVPQPTGNGSIDFLHYHGVRVEAVVYAAHGTNGWWIKGYEACSS